MKLNRIQNETHAIQEILESFLFKCHRAFGQTWLFNNEIGPPFFIFILVLFFNKFYHGLPLPCRKFLAWVSIRVLF